MALVSGKKTATANAAMQVPTFGIEVPQMPMTENEEKELKRVHNMLCYYAKKKEVEHQIREIEATNEQIQKALLIDYADDLASMASSQRADNVLAFADDHVLVKMSKNETKIKELKHQIIKLNNRNRKIVSSNDLMQILIDLGHPMKLKEIEEMIWEVDEDLDKCLNWDEFKLMYERNITDRTGLEPSRMVSTE